MLQLHLCKPSYEHLLSRELEIWDLSTVNSGKGWVLVNGETIPEELCFAVFTIFNAEIITAKNVNEFSEEAINIFWKNHKDIKITSPWSFTLEEAEEPGLAARKKNINDYIIKKLLKKMPRIAKLAYQNLPKPEEVHQGLFVFVPNFESIIVGTEFIFWGQHRQKDDPLAPSRSYLKVEEAYQILGLEPQRLDLVTDLGAAPGGWSYSASRRGAKVTAVDNGPLKGGAFNNHDITHLQEDAFRFIPKETQDWLFCDMIENPYRIISEILLPWIENDYTKNFVVNFKVGKCDPVELLRKINDPTSKFNLTKHCYKISFRQLFHDREEITCVGTVL